MPRLTEEDRVRLIATRFVRKGFRGRARLTEQAAGGDLIALAVLESRLGLADRSAIREAYEETLDRAIRSGSFTQEQAKKLSSSPKGSRIPRAAGLFAKDDTFPSWYLPPKLAKDIRDTQQKRRALTYSKPEEKPPAYQRFLEERLRSNLKRLYPYGSRYNYQKEVRFVAPGQEHAEKAGGWKQFWYISTERLDPEVRKLQQYNRKHIYLSRTKRVKRGPYGSLITQTRPPHPLGADNAPRWIRVREQEED